MRVDVWTWTHATMCGLCNGQTVIWPCIKCARSSAQASLIAAASPTDLDQPVQRMSNTALYMIVPDTMAHWPWSRRINPYYEDVAAESAEWLRSFEAFSPGLQAVFDRCKFGEALS